MVIPSTSVFDELVVFGARGTALMFLRAMEECWQGRVRILALVDDIENGFQHPTLNVPVISSAERLVHHAHVPVMLGVGSPALRSKIVSQYVAQGATFATVFPALPHLVDPHVVPGAATYCAPHTRIGSSVRIGVGAQVLSGVVAHDVQIGDFCTLGIHSNVAGHVVIGDGVNIAPFSAIGNGTLERPLSIGDGAVIGTGCVVLRDVPAGARMLGNPAMTLEEWRRFKRLLKKSP